MKIKVEVIGDQGFWFWTGYSTEIDHISDAEARDLARAVIKDGKTRQQGKWRVSEEKQQKVDYCAICGQPFVGNEICTLCKETIGEQA